MNHTYFNLVPALRPIRTSLASELLEDLGVDINALSHMHNYTREDILKHVLAQLQKDGIEILRKKK